MQTHRQTLPLFKRLRHLLRKMRRLLPYPETDSCRIRSHRRNLHHLRRHYENQYKTGSLQRIPNVSIRPDVSPDTALPPSRQSSLQRLQTADTVCKEKAIPTPPAKLPKTLWTVRKIRFTKPASLTASNLPYRLTRIRKFCPGMRKTRLSTLPKSLLRA